VGELAQSGVEVLQQRGVGDQQAVLLALVGAVHAGEGLHEQRALDAAVQVEGVQRGGVEAGEHHVLDDHDLELVARVLDALLDGWRWRLGRRMCALICSGSEGLAV
jgi:hypothetical protein